MDAKTPSKLDNRVSLEPLMALVSSDLERVNAAILARTGSDVTMIPEVAQHLISSGGKRLRPMLTLAFAAMSGARGEEPVLLAAATEFMHTATLLHDDVVDDSNMRRGRPTARRVWGNQASVLVGDFLLGQAFKMMVDAGSLDCLRVLSKAAAVIAEGEVLQLAYVGRLDTSEETYFQVISSKTAALFAAACEVGSLIAGKAELSAAARDFGHALGMAFQLVDDALDYDGEAMRFGKNIGDDFREGKMTLPVLVAIKHASPKQRMFWERVFSNASLRDEAALNEALRFISENDGVAFSRQKAALFIDEALQNISVLPEGSYRRALEDAANFVVQRNF